MSDEQFDRLPSCFQELIEIDRQLQDKVIGFTQGQRLVTMRRSVRRPCEIQVLQPGRGGLA
jgi:hypothetical protein